MTDTNTIKNIDKDDILYIRTKKIPTIKALIESLKEMFKDVCIKFSPKQTVQIPNDPNKKTKTIGGMSISAFNSGCSIYVKVKLEADKFEEYYCSPIEQKDYISIGINMLNFFKIIKILNNDDELVIKYNKKTLNKLNVQFINKQKNRVSNYLIKLLDITEDKRITSDPIIDYKVTMPSSEYHSLIKNMGLLSETVDIKFVKGKNNFSLLFECNGEIGTQQTEYTIPFHTKDNNIVVMKNTSIKETDMENKIDTEEIIQGVYDLNSLSYFYKFVPLCLIMEIYFQNTKNSLLFIKYQVADMGTINLAISQVSVNTTKNIDEKNNNDDDDDDLDGMEDNGVEENNENEE